MILASVLVGYALLVATQHGVRRAPEVPLGVAIGLILIATCGWYVRTWESGIADRTVYRLQFEAIATSDSPFQSEWASGDPLFVLYLWTLGRLGVVEADGFFFATGVLVVGLLFFSYCRLVGISAAVLGLATLAASGFLVAYSGTVLRQGIAMSLVLVAFGLLAGQQQGPSRVRAAGVLTLLVAAPLLHWSAIVATIAILVVRVLRPPFRLLVVTWCAAVLIFATGLSRAVVTLTGVSLESLERYSSDSALIRYGATDGGARLDFLLLSALILFALLAGERYVSDNYGEAYKSGIALYLILNTCFLLLGHIAFADRLGAYSWFLGTALVWRPLFEPRPGANQLLLPLGVLAVAALGLSTGNFERLTGVVGL